MNRDEATGATGPAGDGVTGDEFWGATPDWADEPRRPRREKRRGDVTGAVKGLWASAMTAGIDATREHRVIDAGAPRPADDVAVGPQMFDDIDHDPFDDIERNVHRDERAYAEIEVDPTSPHPTDAAVVGVLDDVFDDAALTSMEPISVSERRDMRRRSGAIDPLLMRVGAVAIATTLLVPLVIGLNSGDGDTDTIAIATTEITSSAPSPGVEPAAGDEARQVVGESSAEAALDPANLPRAVPVDDGDDVSPTEGDRVVAPDGGDDGEAGGAPIIGSDDSTGADTARSSTSEDSAAPASGADVMQEDAAQGDTGSGGVNAPATADEPAERANDCAVDYTVVAGDFWLRLADAAGVPLAELLEANGATVDTPLYPGSDICLPAGSTTPEPPSATPQPTPTSTEATTSAPPTTAAPTTATPTTAAPTTAAPTTAATNTDATPAEVEQIIRDVWPDDLEDRALVIASRESNLVPTAKNYCCYGLFQIYWNVHRSWLADIGVTNDQQLFDPETNARAAYTLYQRSGGWGPWSQTDY